MEVYLIPGLGADRRLYQKLDLGGHTPHFLDWPNMPFGSTLKDYAEKLAEQVDSSKPHALVGVSMGGMVAQEMAALTHPEKVILISSWKGPEEMPRPIHLMRRSHPERLLNKTIVESTMPMVRWQMGVEAPEDVKLFDQLVKVHGVDQLKTQINACLSWNGPPDPVKSLVHIHGDSDLLMPIGQVKNARPIHGGSHFMVVTKAKEVGDALRKALGQG